MTYTFEEAIMMGATIEDLAELAGIALEELEQEILED